MASHTSVFAVCLLMGFCAFSASELNGMHILPAWLLAPLLRLRTSAQALAGPVVVKDDGAAEPGPEAVLLQQLKNLDAAREPVKAHAMHAAIAKILRTSGTQNKEALEHFEAARDAAALGQDPDTLLAAQLELAQAYIVEGRARDSQSEVTKASGMLANHFVEHWAKLNRGRGRAKFELGWTAKALDYFLEAEKQAHDPEDKVRIACDIAMARGCLGQIGTSVEPLRQALEVLNKARKAGSDAGLPDTFHSELTGEVHFRLAEAFHSMKDTTFATAHYTKALHLQKKSLSPSSQRALAIEKGIRNLDRGRAPELYCPRLPRSYWDKLEEAPQNMKGNEFTEKINELLAEHKYDKVESELKDELRKRSRPYKGLEAATALNMLGSLYRKQTDPSKAAKQYRQALHAAIVTEPCCSAGSQEATTAYEGLRDVKAELTSDEERVAAAAISRYFDILNRDKPENVVTV